MAKTLADFLKSTGNQYASIVNDGITAADVSGWVDSGSYALNALLSGSIYKGFPGNKIIVLAGEPATGKTFFALAAVKHFLDTNDNGYVIYFESESAITKQMIEERGIDKNRIGIVPVSTVQEFRTQVLKIIEEYENTPKEERVPMMFVLDSLGMLSTSKEIDDSTAGNDTRDMTRAALLKGAFRVLTLKLGKVGIPMIVTNHVYENVGGGLYASKVVSGGSGALYASSTILTLSKAKERDSDGQVSGAIVTLTAYKSRLTREGSKVKCLIRFDGGLDRYYGLLDIAEEAKIFKKVANRYELPDGTKVFGASIMKEPTKYFTQEILDKIDKYCQKKFCYGNGEIDKEENVNIESEEL